MRVHVDSSAARGVFQRQGAGRIRHLEVRSFWVQEALRQKNFSLHAVKTDENLADIGPKALQVTKLEKFRDELNVISLEEFNQGDTEKIQAKSLVGAVTKLQNAIQVMTALGLIQGVKAEEEKEAERSISMTQLMVWFSVVWTVVSFTWMIARSLKSWLAKEKVGKSKNEEEEGESQNVTAEAVVKKMVNRKL